MTEEVSKEMNDKFTMPEASAYLNASKMTIEKYYLRGDLPAERTVGGGYIFTRGDLDAIRPHILAHKVKFRTDAAIETRRKRFEGEE